MDKQIRVSVEAWIDYRDPPASTEEEILRRQANINISVIARKFSEPLENLLKAALVPDRQRKSDG